MRLVFRLLRELLRVLAFPILAVRRALASPRGAFLEVTIDGAFPAFPAHRPLFPFLRFPFRSSSRASVAPLAQSELAQVITLAKSDPRVAGLLVSLRGLGAGMATAKALRDSLTSARDAGLMVVVHLPLGADTREMFVASAASRVLVGPRTTVSPVGFSSQVRYFRGALDRVGLIPEVYARGRYKSAGEQVMREGMSEPQREQLSALLDSQYSHLLFALGQGRGMSNEEVAAVVDEAPYDAREALARRLVDGIAYEDEVALMLAPKHLPEHSPEHGLKRAPDGVQPPRVVPAWPYARARRASAVRSVRAEPFIGVIEVHGPIVHRSGFSLGPMAVDAEVIGAARAARANPHVKGVVLHVDSPGGSALASDRMHHELVQLAREKPLVACMANVAASGGYYVAVAAHRIIAEPVTITGSIGVISARVAFEPLLARLGIATEVIKRGARASIFSEGRPFGDDEKAVMARQLESTYQGFLEVVAAGRKRDLADIELVAQGRVWSGAAAKEVGLVDTLGGIDVALAELRQRIGAGGERLDARVVRGGRGSAPLPPPSVGAAMQICERVGGSSEPLARLALLMSGAPRDRVLMYLDMESNFV